MLPRQLLPGSLWSLFSFGIATAVCHNVPDFTTSEAGNPFVEGWYADPDTQFYNGHYWVYPTSSHEYDEQIWLDAFSSPDLVHWKKHSNVLVAKDFAWAKRAIWAPAPIERNGLYYLYFGANDIQSNREIGGIGVGVADRPEGPYKDPLGHPLIGKYYNGAQPIDQDVFIDDDGQAYIYYGGHSHANVAKLKRDMVNLDSFEDGTIFKEITPENYVEGPQMMKRNGKYYFFWSEGGWGGPDYAVSYSISDSPTGPFKRIAKILQQDEAVATGSGHNAVIHVPGTDIYYIIYHRRPLGVTEDNNRRLAYDRLHFNKDGTIQPVKMLVHDNFDDGKMISWKTYGGTWNAASNALQASSSSSGSKALLNTNFTNFVYEIDVTISELGSSRGDAGIIFRVSDPSVGTDAYRGYYAGIGTNGNLVLGRADWDKYTELASASADVQPRKKYHITVRAKGDKLHVAVNDSRCSMIAVRDGTYGYGMDGVRVFDTKAAFDNVNITKI